MVFQDQRHKKFSLPSSLPLLFPQTKKDLKKSCETHLKKPTFMYLMPPLRLLERRAVVRQLQLSRQQVELQQSGRGFCQSLHIPASFLKGAGFSFISCPCHPPSILPTSSSGSERAIYFLLSSDLDSKSTRRRTFAVSNFRIATRT